MGIEAVKEEILDSAKQEAFSIVSEAKKEANRMLKDAEKKVDEIRERYESAGKKAIEELKRQEISSAELEIKKMLLEEKKQLVDKIFEEGRKKIGQLDEKKREMLVKSLLDRAKKDIEISHIFCNGRDAKFLKLYKIEHMDLLGGLIAENKERTIRVDYSFETILQSIKETEMQSLSKILFG